MPPRRANRSLCTGCTGFTLVELMVALVVMALLSLMSWRGLDAMARAQEQTQARAAAAPIRRRAVNFHPKALPRPRHNSLARR